MLAKKKFLHELFESAGLSDKNFNFITDNPVGGCSLLGFSAFCIKNKSKIERWFDTDLRKDIKNKPASQLSYFLELHGISWAKLKPSVKNGKKIYYYEIKQSSIDEIERLVKRRLDTILTEKWRQDRINTKKNRLFEPDEFQ